MKRLFFILFVIILFFEFIFGCIGLQTYEIDITEIGTYPQPLFEPLPLKAGAYYGEEFRTFDTIQHHQFLDMDLNRIFKIQMGKANIALFDYILSAVFETATPVQYLTDGSDHKKDIDLIIEPTVHSYTYSNITADGAYIHITYAINIYLPDGEQIDYWRIKGSGYLPLFEIKDDNTAVIELTQMAMREVAANFIADFCKQGEIQKLFYNQCNP